ncbi:MAG: NFACT family protein [Candidatus Altiarchaeota archaeon]|nr:NFACT family protein [Candidatus Altiarchaeota archaeon]
MKKELSSVDLRILCRELNDILSGMKVDKAYQVGKRDFVLKFFGRGSVEVVVAANFMCATKYKRPAPKTPSSFAMQLRKNLGGAAVMSVSQHGFERIVEVEFQSNILVIELFSKGNVILCDRDYKIIGLLDWQKWRDRVLGVGKTYSYPPAVVNPYTLDLNSFTKIFSDSKKPAAATLATRLSLGGFYAEKICEDAEVDGGEMPDAESIKLLWKSLEVLLKKVDGKIEACILGDNISPFGGSEHVYTSFNDAVDEYFSSKQALDANDALAVEVQEKKNKYEDIYGKQVIALEDAKKTVVDRSNAGDLIYQNMTELNEVWEYVRAARKQGLTESEINVGLKKWDFVVGLEGFELTVEL